MRVLFWYCDKFAWTPTLKTLGDVREAGAGEQSQVVVAFVHVEPGDAESGSSAETKLVKNAKWVARKWEVDKILLHSFTHLGEEKADPGQAKLILERARIRCLPAAGRTWSPPRIRFCA